EPERVPKADVLAGPDRPTACRLIPHLLPGTVPGAGLYPLVRQHGHPPDLLHQRGLDGLLPGDFGRMPHGPVAQEFPAWFKSLGARVTLFSIDGGVGLAVSDGRERLCRRSGPRFYAAKCYPGLNQAEFPPFGDPADAVDHGPGVRPALELQPVRRADDR